MAETKLDIRQSETRILQDQLNNTAVKGMDDTLAGINSEVTSPGRLIAQATPTLVVTVGNGTVTNPNTGKKRVLPFINNVPVVFTGGTITFPSASGTITVSPGTNAAIVIGANQFVAVVVQLTSGGQITLTVGNAAASLGAVVIPSGSPSLLSLGYIIVQSNGSSTIQNVTNAMLYQFAVGGSAGSQGAGGGDFGLQTTNYNVVFQDTFEISPTLSGSPIDSTKTTAAYVGSDQWFTLSYDATRTVTGTGTSMTLSGLPSFTVVVGDILRVGNEARRITGVTSQVLYTIESAFTANPTAAAATVSQCVHTLDLNDFAFEGQAANYVYPEDLNTVLVDYEDNDSGSTFETGVPNVAFIASATDGASDYTEVSLRAEEFSELDAVTALPTPDAELYIRFFSNKTSGSGTVKLLEFKAFFHDIDGTSGTGFALNQAYGYLDGSVTAINCDQPTVVGGNTQIHLDFSYVTGLNAGTVNGQLEIFINGQKIPRYISGSDTPDMSYTEVNNRTIQLSGDFSGYDLSFEVLKQSAVIDSAGANAAKFSAMWDAIVGDAADVASGAASHTSLVTAIANTAVDGTILVLRTYTTSESVTIATRRLIEGLGHGTTIAGTVTVSSTLATIKKLRFGNTVTISGTANYIRECFAAPGVAITESTPGSNSLLIIGE